MVKDDKKPKHIPKMENKKAFFNYEIVEKIEAGMSLQGSEVKSLRLGGADLMGSFARIDSMECWLMGCNIAPYKEANLRNHEPLRKRKLLLHKKQILKISNKLQQKGLTLVPLRIYFNDHGMAKIELALATGKRQYDKREKLKQRQQKGDMDRGLKKYKR
ncbi:MAG: SsrA-binding protein SmpB [Planctomycetaceae bacterium]|nr:SsrA-binding protein SmpB [Planctomycetaceae bacterium]